MAMVLRKLFASNSSLEEDLKLMRNKAQTLFARAADVTTEVINAELHPAKKRKIEVHNWMENVQELKCRMDCIEEEVEQGSGSGMRNKILDIIKEIEELLEHATFHNGLTIHDLASSSLPLVTTDMKGQQFENNLRKILSWLMNDEVYRIGVYGVGGVGKTTLATHIHNQLLRVPGKFATVCWVTVSQKCTIWELQRKIAKELKLPKDVLEEEDKMRRPAILSEALEKKRANVDHVVVILDDMWNHFPVEEVGLPMGENGCKLLLTSRSLDVCRKMECKELVNVGTLSEKESWSLFRERLGNYDDLSSEAKDVARLVAKECDGLPLGIKIVAASMRGIYDAYEWNTTLEDLKDPTRIHEGMENEVFPSLQLSYSRLNNVMLQNCFLSCALYPEDYYIERDMLVNLWIMEGHLEEIQSRQKQLDKAYTMLNKLLNACLLEVPNSTRNCVKMHDLIRDMTIGISSKRHHVVIKAGMQLQEVPRLQEWAEELTKVSLVNNNISEIPPGMIPRCTNLSTLLLRGNPLMSIPNSFFRFLNSLKFLDLSETRIRCVPDSISYLKNLTALKLCNCGDLAYIPSFAKLSKLRHLDLTLCVKLENIPQGMEELVNLECLILEGTNSFTVSFNEVMAKLSNLQCLKLHCGVKDIQIREMQQLGHLESLTGFHTLDKGNFNIYLKSQHFCQLSSYHFIIGNCKGKPFCHPFAKRSTMSIKIIRCLEFEGGAVQLPGNLQELQVKECGFQLRNLGDALPSLAGLTRLESIIITDCQGIESIWSDSSFAKPALINLEELLLWHLPSFKALAKGRVELPLGSFSNLKKLQVVCCYKMETLFTPCLLKGRLQNLEVIEIHMCNEIEEIFAVSKLDADANEEIIVELPKLRVLSLEFLPKLTSFCKNGLIYCNTIERTKVIGCPKLRGHGLQSELFKPFKSI